MKLEAENISFCYHSGGRRILNQISLAVDSGARLGLTAPSGFGKTTLCKILAGYEKADSGCVRLDGKPLEEYRGYCPVQMIWQHPEQSVDPRWKMKKLLQEAGISDSSLIKRLGIKEEWMNRYPGELSGGELQRFCIAGALGEQTKILLADEITTMLDLVTQNEIWYILLEEVKRRKIGMLMVSHSERLMGKICTERIQWEAAHGCKRNAGTSAAGKIGY
ncbi:MAG: ATP-binding cassette domain-containing protein [Clostridium sp.]